LGNTVRALAVNGSDLYVGGNFTYAVFQPGLDLYHIAKLTNDTDGDGLPDDWERNGVTINGTFINLPSMGRTRFTKICLFTPTG